MREWLFIISLLLTVGCASTSPSNKIIERVSGEYQLDTSDYLAFIYYDPWGCLSCNYLLKNILYGNAGKSLWGENFFFLYPGLREAELKDTEKKLKEVGDIDARSINDNDMYLGVRSKVDIRKEDIGKPLIVLVSMNSDEYYYFLIRDPEISVKLDDLGKLRR